MDAVGGFSLRVETHDGPVVWLSGELDSATSPKFDECLRDLDGQTVTIDFSGLTFMDSSGLAVLIRRNKGHRLVLRAVQPAQMKLFAIAGLCGVFNFVGAARAA